MADELLELKIKTLLTAYNHRNEKIVNEVGLAYKTSQIFIAGLFLLITYIFTTESYHLFIIVPPILFVFMFFIMAIYSAIAISKSCAKRIEGMINNLLKFDTKIGEENFLEWYSTWDYATLNKKGITGKGSLSFSHLNNLDCRIIYPIWCCWTLF